MEISREYKILQKKRADSNVCILGKAAFYNLSVYILHDTSVLIP